MGCEVSTARVSGWAIALVTEQNGSDRMPSFTSSVIDGSSCVLVWI